MGYYKNIAVIRALKDGFSADGGELSGLVKVEKYGSDVKVEVTMINFAPLTEGRYVCVLSDGACTVMVEGADFEGRSELDPAKGFAALICYVNGGVFPVASAICGNYQGVALSLKSKAEELENTKKTEVYEDEALAEENYYEYAQTFSDGGTVCQNPPQKEAGDNPRQNDPPSRAVPPPPKPAVPFYEKMKAEIEGILKSYPAAEGLEETIENSRFVKISYGDGKHYVFGVLFSDEIPQYICYGVPSADPLSPPKSMAGQASYIPVADGGYWVMYQDAATGAAVGIS